jgi:hypothetical protein
VESDNRAFKNFVGLSVESMANVSRYKKLSPRLNKVVLGEFLKGWLRVDILSQTLTPIISGVSDFTKSDSSGALLVQAEMFNNRTMKREYVSFPCILIEIIT